MASLQPPDIPPTRYPPSYLNITQQQWKSERSRDSQVQFLLNKLRSHPKLPEYPDLLAALDILIKDEPDNDMIPECRRGKLEWRASHVGSILCVISRLGDVNRTYGKGETLLHVWSRKGWWWRTPVGPELILLGADINATDNLGLTALHYACAFGDTECISLLLRCGASLAVADKLGTSPLQYALACNVEVDDPVFAAASQGVPERLRCPPKFTEEEQKASDPRSLDMKDVNMWIQTIVPDGLNDQEHLNRLQQVLARPGLGLQHHNPEVTTIQEQLVNLFQILNESITSYDQRLNFKVSIAGSMAEGTRYGIPREFDVVLDLIEFEDLCDSVEDDRFPAGFVTLKQTSGDKQEQFKEFFMDGYLNMRNILKPLTKLMIEAYHETSTWSQKGIENLFPGEFSVGEYGDIGTFHIWWHGPHYNVVHISVDVVPALSVSNWRPRNCPSVSPLGSVVNTSDIRLIMKAPQEYVMEKIGLEWEGLLYSVSLHQAEIATICALPDPARQAYILAKHMADSVPKINKDKDIFSFMMKTALLKITAHKLDSGKHGNCSTEGDMLTLDSHIESLDEHLLETVTWADEIFQYILEAVERGCLTEYFEPGRDLFSKILVYWYGEEKNYPVLKTLKTHCLVIRCLLSTSQQQARLRKDDLSKHSENSQIEHQN